MQASKRARFTCTTAVARRGGSFEFRKARSVGGVSTGYVRVHCGSEARRALRTSLCMYMYVQVLTFAPETAPFVTQLLYFFFCMHEIYLLPPADQRKHP